MIPTKDAASGEIKYTARSRAVVIDNRDPLKRGRIRVKHPLLGETVWIPYLKTPGLFDVPEINDHVFIESDCGYYTHPVAWGNIISGEDANPNIPIDFRREVPTNRGLYSPEGHKIELDDGIATIIGSDPSAINISAQNRGIRLTSRSGNKIWIKEESDLGNQHILIEDNKGNYLRLTQQDSSFQIFVRGNVIINCQNASIVANDTATVEADTVKLGAGATESVILGTTFKTFFDTHVHTGGTGAPTIPMPTSTLSSKVKVE